MRVMRQIFIQALTFTQTLLQTLLQTFTQAFLQTLLQSRIATIIAATKSRVGRYFITCLCVLSLGFLSACSDDGLESNADSTMSANDLDKKSYAGLEDVFADTSIIQTNGKYMLLIFGANGCKYCDNLKEDIKSHPAIKALLQEHFTSYYINTSYSKPHLFRIGDSEHSIPTKRLAEIYRVGPTPTLIFAAPDGKTILSFPSYLPPVQLQALLDFIAQGSWKRANGAGNDEAKLATIVREHLQQALQNALDTQEKSTEK